MKNCLLFTLAVLGCNIVCFSQGGKHGGGAAPASSAATASGTPSAPATPANAQPAYVYRLKYHYHLKYGTTKIIPKSIDRDGKLPDAKIIVETSIHKDTIYKDLFGKGAEQPENQVFCKDCKYKKFRTVNHDWPKQTIDVPVGSIGSPFIHNDVYIDSVSRYWNRRKLPFSRHRLRVSVAQADSGKLQIVIYANNFPDSTHFPSGSDIDNSDGELDCVSLTIGKTLIGKDFAKPLTAKDSAQNFYLQINNKSTLNDPIAFISLPYAMTQYGALTIPFKYRWKPNRSVQVQSGSTTQALSATSGSTASINVAAYISRKWGRTRFYFDPTKTSNSVSFMAGGFVGPSLLPLTANNIDSSKKTTADPSQVIALSVGGFAALEWKSIDFGFFTGLDAPLVRNTGWVYRQKLWIGFGIGVNLGMFTSSNVQFQK